MIVTRARCLEVASVPLNRVRVVVLGPPRVLPPVKARIRVQFASHLLPLPVRTSSQHTPLELRNISSLHHLLKDLDESAHSEICDQQQKCCGGDKEIHWPLQEEVSAQMTLLFFGQTAECRGF